MAEKPDETPKTQKAETTPVFAEKATSPMQQPILTQKINTQETRPISMALKSLSKNNLREVDRRRRNLAVIHFKIHNSLSLNLQY